MGQTGTAPKIVVIVLNWNGRDDTLACLESLGAVEYPNWEILVVDNGSQDGSVHAVRKSYPSVGVIALEKNIGFTGGNNRGIEAALGRGADFVLLLNNDTMVAPDLLRAFMRAAEGNANAGVFGAKIYYLADPSRLWYGGARWNSSRTNLEVIGQGMLDSESEFGEVRDTGYANGCAMLIRASALQLVGLLDDRFFILYEEVDWCCRAKRAGFRCLFVPGAKVWHRVSTTFGGGRSLVFEYFLLRNYLLWAERNLNLRKRFRVWGETLNTLFPFQESRRMLWQAISGRLGMRRMYWEIRALARDRKDWVSQFQEPDVRMVRWTQWRAVRDYLLRRFGDCPRSIRLAAARAKPPAPV